MRNFIQVVLLLVVGGGVGALIVGALGGEGGDGRSGRSGDTDRSVSIDGVGDAKARIAALEDENARLRAENERLRQRGRPDLGPNPYPNDTPEKVEELLRDAYADNNVDWLLEAIERLLRMGEPGYPILRRMLEDIIFRAKFMPSQSDFRVDQLYRVGKVFTKLEQEFIGFLNYLLLDKSTNYYFKQGAMMGAAFYVGSNAPGSDELQQTLMQLFLEQQGGPGSMLGLMPGMGKMQQRMQVFAMAMSGDKRMIEPLRDKLNDTKDKQMQGDIVGALSYLGDPAVLPLIKDRLDPTQGDHRRDIDALGRLGTEDAHSTASDFLKSIPDSKRFYQHTRRYMRAGGGSQAVLLMKERIEANPNDPAVADTIGSLRRYPTQESYDTLMLITQSSQDEKTVQRAASAAEDVQKRLRGVIPDPPVK